MYRTIQLLSLDVVTGALVSGVMAASILKVELPWTWWIGLPLSVWVLYTADHLLDALKVGMEASSERHRFHAVWIRPLGIFWVVGLLICMIYLPLVVPPELLWLGLALGLLAGLHFFLVWVIKGVSAPWLAKEIGVAMVYTLGVWGGPVMLNGLGSAQEIWIPLVQFFFLALFNLMTFSIYEEMLDEQDGFTSWVRGLGTRVSYRLLLLFNGIIVGLGTLDLWVKWDVSQGWLQVTFLGMLLILNWVAWNPSVFSLHHRYRAVADGVFMIPVVWLPAYLTGL